MMVGWMRCSSARAFEDLGDDLAHVRGGAAFVEVVRHRFEVHFDVREPGTFASV